MESASDTGDSGANKKKQVTTIGDFELKKKLGKGATGEVFLARQISLDRLVAVKTLSKELAKKEDAVARFLREAPVNGQAGPRQYREVLCGRFIQGHSLRRYRICEWQKRPGLAGQTQAISIGDAVHIAMVAAAALKHAHDQNMVHRDVKPDNILLTAKGVVKVADFGAGENTR